MIDGQGPALPLRSIVSRLFPPFRPHPLLASGHAQTLAGVFLPSPARAYRARQHRLTLCDGDMIVLHDDCPAGWRSGDRAALLIHGLAGCHSSGYMRRTAHKLGGRGIRAFRMDLRGCGAGQGLAHQPYHSGRSEDAAAAIEALARIVPDSPLTLVGFSLGGNITLKLAGELGPRACGNLDSLMAICPPVDLAVCSRQIQKRSNRPYDRYFVALLLRQLDERRRRLPAAPTGRLARRPRSLWEFDDSFTAVVCGFGTADNYYACASSAPWIARIELPTLILSARDDPMIPPDCLERIDLPPAVRLHMSDRGGHLGFVGRGGVDADRRWMDWRVVDWVAAAGVPAASPRAVRA
jgi:predicted alpha/beta-fold hydrolase